MSRSLLLALCASFVLLVPPAPTARGEFEILPEKSYHLDLLVRKPHEEGFSRDTRVVSINVFADKKSQRLFYVADQGKSLAVVPSAKGTSADAKGAKWRHRLLLPVRKSDEKEFGDKTAKIGVEVYHDKHTGNWLYVSHSGSVSVLPGEKRGPENLGQQPKWLYRLPLKVRPYDEHDWDGRVYPCNVEVYQDQNIGALVYVAENGALAVIPAANVGAGRKADPPIWSHSLDLSIRKAGEDVFDAHTTINLCMNVYRDTTRGAWVYITDPVRLAVVPDNQAIDVKARVRDLRAPKWLHGLRPPGVAKQWSAEVFDNPNAGHLLYGTAGGALAVVRGAPSETGRGASESLGNRSMDQLCLDNGQASEVLVSRLRSQQRLLSFGPLSGRSREGRFHAEHQ